MYKVDKELHSIIESYHCNAVNEKSLIDYLIDLAPNKLQRNCRFYYHVMPFQSRDNKYHTVTVIFDSEKKLFKGGKDE